MKIEIKHWVTGAILFEGAFFCLSAAVEAAVKNKSNLHSANLRSANLRSANLRSADLSSIKYDLWAVLTCAKNEVGGLRLALIEGRVNGSSYIGDCACLVGTIANVRHAQFDAMESLKPVSDRPAERFFLGITTGDTPDKNQFAKLAVEWIDEWAALLGIDLMAVTAPASQPAPTENAL